MAKKAKAKSRARGGAPKSPFRLRIVGYGVKPANQFLANPENWRVHPQVQQTAMKAALQDIGWLAPVVENVRTGHVVDGHMRVLQALAEGEETPVPYVQVDLSPAEERLALAVFDPIGALAGRDDEKLVALVADLPRTRVDLDAVLRRSRAPVRGLTRDVTVNACTCCQTKCLPGCGCYPKGA